MVDFFRAKNECAQFLNRNFRNFKTCKSFSENASPRKGEGEKTNGIAQSPNGIAAKWLPDCSAPVELAA
jgi:hypothetical protein